MPRPVDYSSQIMPMIQTPGHSSFPAGHAVETFMFATVLAELAAGREQAALPDRVARCAINSCGWPREYRVNRVVAGVHFPVDMAAGMVLGLQLGRYFVALAKGSAEPLWSWTFNANNYGDEDFPWRNMLAAIENNQPASIPRRQQRAFLTSGSQFTLASPSLLKARCAGYGIAPPLNGRYWREPGRRTMQGNWSFTKESAASRNDLDLKTSQAASARRRTGCTRGGAARQAG